MKATQLKKCAVVLSLAGLLTACQKEQPDPVPTVSEPAVVIEEEVQPQEEVREPYTKAQFLSTFYEEVPEEVGNLYVFLECTRANSDATFTDWYFNYFGYENMESVIKSYWDVMGCEYTDQMAADVFSFYAERDKLQVLCQVMYNNLNSDGTGDLSLLSDVGREMVWELEEQSYVLTMCENTYTSEEEEWFKVEEGRLLVNNGNCDIYRIGYADTPDAFNHYLILPDVCEVLCDGTILAIQNDELNARGFYTAEEVGFNARYFVIVSNTYGENIDELPESILETQAEWMAEANAYALEVDETSFYLDKMERDLTMLFPIYNRDSRTYSVYDYIRNLPDMTRENADGTPTEYGLGIADLNASSMR